MAKKVLLLVIFSLTLFPLFGIGDGSIVMAQHWTYEDGSYWLPDLDVESDYVKCNKCEQYYDPEQDHECLFKCEYCGDRVKDMNQHYRRSLSCANAAGYKEDEDEYCLICGQPKNECMCYPRNDSGDSGGTNGGGSTGPNTGSSGTVGVFPSSSVRHISVAELKIRPGVKTVSQFKLPSKLHAQTRRAECVIRAYAFMAELKGSDYEAAYKTLTQIAEARGVDLDFPTGGVPNDMISTIFRDFCDVGVDLLDRGKIEDYIDKGTAIGAILSTNLMHMITIIGNDKDFFYTSDGSSSGNVTIYDKKDVEYKYIYLINRLKTPYK